MFNFLNLKDIKIIRFSWKRVFFIFLFSLGLIAILFALLFFYSYSYRDKVLPGVYVGDINIGGLNRTELTDFLQKMETKLSDHGIEFYFDINGKEEKIILYPNAATEDIVENLIDIDIRKESDYFLSFRKTDNFLSNIVSTVFTRFSRPHLSLQTVNLQKQKMFLKIEELVKPYISEPIDAKILINSINPLDYQISSSTAGVTFNYEKVAGKILSDWTILKSPEIKIETFERKANILENDILAVINDLTRIFSYGRIDILYTDPHTKKEYNWYLSQEELQEMVLLEKNTEEKVIYSLDEEKLLNFLESDIAPIVNVEAQDAKFELGEGNKVNKFQGSRPGIKIELDETIEAIKNAFISRNYYNDNGILKIVNVVINTIEPKIKTAEVNDLGISEILGIGYSNFKGSSDLRIKNIKNAAYNKLNGLIIEPGEEFSLVNALSPFTSEAGYYPELVIKGDRVVPEIGGGLCQVGSTMFRTAMNSGLEITERRNHSLVVSYYNDARNGLPGTDATIYEPHPDFRFVNDTGKHILITANMDLGINELSFTFWGTNDGRQGYYSAPVVSEWFQPGEEKIIETTDLKPGVMECQHEYIGAKASFVYTRILSNKEKKETLYESYYRPLAKMCLLGVEEKNTEEITNTDQVQNEENNSNSEEINSSLEGEIKN